MLLPNNTVVNQVDDHDEWANEVKAFEESKAGVKGLSDAGITKLPKFFIHAPETMEFSASQDPIELPVIDLGELGERRKAVVDEIRKAAEEWGAFRLVNHGVSEEVMESMLEAAKRFHEQPAEAKKTYYVSLEEQTGGRRRVGFSSNVPRRRTDAACWRDLLTCAFLDDELDPEAIPSVCRKEMLDYVKGMIVIRETLAELFSEALGLRSDYLSQMECMKSELLSCAYHPVCPEPNKTLGTGKHFDQSIITLLLHDDVGGLQILHDHQWIDVHPIRGTFIANLGEPMQTISDGKFKAVVHRVLAPSSGPRVAVGCFFNPSKGAALNKFRPIQELLARDDISPTASAK